MSSTRTNSNGDFRPERWASSPALDRPLKANLVAARCSTLETPDLRELVWFVQALSLHHGGLRWAAAEIAPDSIAPEDRVKWLASLCLDPATNAELQLVAPKLHELLASYTRQRSDGGAITEIGTLIEDALNYCSHARCMVLVSGNPRIGKTWAAKRWTELRPGRARFCEVPSSSDDSSFFMALARALGITIESTVKRLKLQPRIETVLRCPDLTLVMDECANLYPGHCWRDHSRPARVSWIMGMVNAGASIALLVTPNFFASQQDYLDHSRWNDTQFYGRISRYVTLPERLSLANLEKVARAWLPHGEKRAIESLADMANLSQKHAAAIEHAVKLASYFAKQDGRDRAEWPDVLRAIKSGGMPADTALAAAIEHAAARRKTPANGSRR